MQKSQQLCIYLRIKWITFNKMAVLHISLSFFFHSICVCSHSIIPCSLIQFEATLSYHGISLYAKCSTKQYMSHLKAKKIKQQHRKDD